ncbi:MAG: DUF2970 domain-containing protein [Methylococcaceae bacterium]|nr:DUF2970 domain-containing protein [Methylococcaceae bacterium]
MSKPTITQIVKSVLAAFIGVQSEDNRKKAFEQGSFSTYIIVGLICTILFVVVVASLVSIIV